MLSWPEYSPKEASQIPQTTVTTTRDLETTKKTTRPGDICANSTYTSKTALSLRLWQTQITLVLLTGGCFPLTLMASWNNALGTVSGRVLTHESCDPYRFWLWCCTHWKGKITTLVYVYVPKLQLHYLHVSFFLWLDIKILKVSVNAALKAHCSTKAQHE